MEKVKLSDAFDRVTDYWTPALVGELNGQYVKIAKLKGEFLWHHHEEEDEMFWVVKGQLVLKLRDRDVILDEGELFIVPRGTEHKPVAPEEVWVALFEPASTVNTGNVRSARTQDSIERL